MHNLSPNGLMLIVMDAESREEADAIVKYVENHTSVKQLF